jgi:hypothetical protein
MYKFVEFYNTKSVTYKYICIVSYILPSLSFVRQFRLKLIEKLTPNQGDLIGRIFAFWAISYFICTVSYY